LIDYIVNDKIKNDLTTLYTNMLSPLVGLAEAKKLVEESIELCEKQSLKEGTRNLPTNFGEIVVNQLCNEPGYFKDFVDIAYRDGATTQNIIDYWNMPDLERRMAEWSSNIFEFAAFMHIKESEKLDDKAAMIKIRKLFPNYGNTNDDIQEQSEDRPLSVALRDRINIYSANVGDQKTIQESQKYSSYNAYIRDLIRKRII
jgi:hypothetical protein